MYVDESGDPGTHDPANPHSSGSRHYIVTGIIIPTDTWSNNLKILASLRSRLKSNYGFPARKELHGAQIINPRNDPAFSSIGTRLVRNKMYLECMEYYAKNMSELEIINIHLDKMNPRSVKNLSGVNVQDLTWTRLLERCQTFLSKNDGLGIIFADDTNETQLRNLIRKMRKYHYVGSAYGSGGRPANTSNIIEDPIIRNSQQSYLIQVADMTSHILYRKLYPKPSYKKYKTEQIFDVLDTVLVKSAHASCPYGQGIVRV
ncbi:DUF3800 domain-containing protein [Deinococcus arenicola]|uniref:DUF3800 domain-containing protein n=1 Tax=Deinococcus arenicola TaxID=2994950 RepID=A0ABU4DKR4_9DEIO|nr:DUF3800 domain-containing protein [Deinococcus sp. ZS9-10]MDV6373023.1 DUF3800 domain-containing protein [Deinococcus sp. ZS9-10]